MKAGHIFTPAETSEYLDLAEVRGITLPADVDERNVAIRGLVKKGDLPDLTE
jgi:hypothetical protein